MNFKEIKERQVYYVNFNPVKIGEFNDNHLAVVIKKNKDKKSAIVIPLTSKDKGIGENKICIDMPTLPERLKGEKSYAVYDQVRTVNSGRFQKVYKKLGEDEIAEVIIDEETYINLIKISSLELESKLTIEQKLNLYKEKINDIYMAQVIELAYKIKNKSQKDNNEEIEELKNQIKGILYNIIEYKFTEQHKEHGIEKIILDLSQKKDIELV